MGFKCDKKDFDIIQSLTEDSSASIAKISKKTGIPMATVHHRLKKLKSRGVIKKFTIEIDFEKLGKRISAYVLISADYKELKKNQSSQKKLAFQLKKIPGIEKVDIVTGSTDLIAFARSNDIKELNSIILEKIQSLTGIDKTETLVLLEEV